MTDEEIDKLRKILLQCAVGKSFLAWRSEEATRHDGPGYQGSRYMPVYQKVVQIGNHEDEPVAFLGEGHGGTVALWASEFTEFAVITPLGE